jgi:predicted AAA+ superfamily ATPase
MYIPRLLGDTLERALAQFPAVMVTGPRQSGKTTFVQEELSESHHYVSLDDPLNRSLAREDPNTLLDSSPGRPLVLDEIQYAPELLTYLKIRIDQQRRRAGQFVLTGSQQFQLMANVSESLAGRVAVLELLPFSELEPTGRGHDLASRLFVGDYPDPALHPEMLGLWVKSYLQSYLERDVRQLMNVRDLYAFELFVGLLGARHGQELHQAALASEVGVSQPTVKSWVGVLEASYLLTRVPPYFRNYGKRLLKRPRLYFLDSSLVCALTRLPDPRSALAGPLGGFLLEGWVVSEARKVFAARGKRAPLYHWRTRPGMEVDLLIALPSGLLPVEIKLSATPQRRHAGPLRRFRDLAGADAADVGLVVCNVAEATPLSSGVLALPWHAFPGWLADHL